MATMFQCNYFMFLKIFRDVVFFIFFFHILEDIMCPENLDIFVLIILCENIL